MKGQESDLDAFAAFEKHSLVELQMKVVVAVQVQVVDFLDGVGIVAEYEYVEADTDLFETRQVKNQS